MNVARVLRGVTAVVVSAVAGVVLMLASASPAAAHAVIVDSDPRDGSVVEDSPALLTLTFNEPVQVPPGGVALLDAAGTAVAVTPTAVDSRVEIAVPAVLDDGTYVVSWRVTSGDTHPVAGAFTFSVGAPSDTVAAVPEPSTSAAVSTLRRASQALVYVGTLGVAGLVVFELLLLDATPGAMPVLRRRLDRTRRGLAVLAGAGLLVSVPVTAVWQAGRAAGALLEPEVWTAALGSESALAALLGLVGLVVATIFCPRAGRATRRRWPVPLALGTAALAATSLTVVGHTRTFGPAWLVLGADVLHVAAGSVWFGGIVGLCLLLARSSGASAQRSARTVLRFSTVGAWLVLALALSGVLLAWRILGSLDALVTTGYGRTLLVKVALALSLVAIAAWNRYGLVPHVAEGPEGRLRLRRTVVAEASVLTVLLVVTGVLVSQSPVEARTRVPVEAQSTAPAQEFDEPLGSGSLQARVTPGALGINSLELTVLDADGAPFDPVALPEVGLTQPELGIGPFTPTVTRTGTGTYLASIDLPMAGAWDVTVGVRTSKYENPVVTLPVEVSP
ncbi:copper resistance CopC/CopD family protein [Oerskovia paurometabola]|uniref:Copper resistance protein CopC n=1 Tax=Oerskovia paurometabola TaxID=162170 RepID=A0ABW1XCS5_9CELL|nr:copper resistance protein CopC [Oerskovia paurometabola]MBM7496216.1 copper transport protein [Oerskovia paurometabola]